jgi:hypothetical protein
VVAALHLQQTRIVRFARRVQCAAVGRKSAHQFSFSPVACRAVIRMIGST